MAETDHLFQTTQKFLDPASIQHISAALGEPSEEVQAGLRSVIPTFMSGLITKGSTPEGAEEIVHLAEMTNESGREAVDNIFGDQYHEVADGLSPQTGVSVALLEKLLTIVAPTILSSLLQTIQKEKMTPDNLRNFLQQQKKVLKGYIPHDLKAEEKLTTAIKSTLNDDPTTKIDYKKRKFPFGFIVFILAVIILSFLWFLSRKEQTVTTLTNNISDVHTASTTKESLSTGIVELSAFFQNGDMRDLPKRFTFKEVTFHIGSTDFSSSGTGELDFVASTLKRFPKSVVRIEAYIENTGDPEENLLLSENRAMLVREELIGRGVEPSRVRAEGLGATIGRGQVELVVQRLK